MYERFHQRRPRQNFHDIEKTVTGQTIQREHTDQHREIESRLCTDNRQIRLPSLQIRPEEHPCLRSLLEIIHRQHYHHEPPRRMAPYPPPRSRCFRPQGILPGFVPPVDRPSEPSLRQHHRLRSLKLTRRSLRCLQRQLPDLEFPPETRHDRSHIFRRVLL